MRRRSPPPISPKARLNPVTMMMTTATTLATGPSIDSRMRCSGASQGMPDPAASATSVRAITRSAAAGTRFTEQERHCIAKGCMRFSPSDGVQGGRSERRRQIVAVVSAIAELEHSLYPAVRPSALQKHDDVDRLHNEIARHSAHCLLHQLLEPVEARLRRIGVHRGDAAEMAGVPGFEHVERLRSPHFADNDAIGPQP